MPAPDPLPPQPDDIPWPTRDWPCGTLPPAERESVEALYAKLFDPALEERYGTTLALLMVRAGELVLERYAQDVEQTDTQRSWSMAKSVTHAVAGLLVGDGQLEVSARAPVPEWESPDDLRSGITLEHLLRMTDGLDFVEEYIPGQLSHVIDMLFQTGKDDTAGYARRRAGLHAPGTHWNYSSGTTNVLTSILGGAVGGGREGMSRYMSERLFEPIGMRSASPRFDEAGTFIGSSFVFATPRDFMRFGLLYLRDGTWEGECLLPEGWVDHARTLTPASGGEYGAHWWLDRVGQGTFSALGYEGQYLVLDPRRDVMLLRLGRSTPTQRERVEAELTAILSSIAPRVPVDA